MIQTAHDLDLGDGRRFPPAEICACARLLEDSGSLQPCRLAQELSSSIFEVWWDALWYPCKYHRSSPLILMQTFHVVINLEQDFLRPRRYLTWLPEKEVNIDLSRFRTAEMVSVVWDACYPISRCYDGTTIRAS